jgi:hypothetical protein
MISDAEQVLSELVSDHGGEAAFNAMSMAAARSLAHVLCSHTPSGPAIAALTQLLPKRADSQLTVNVQYIAGLLGRCQRCGHCEQMPEPTPTFCLVCGSGCCQPIDDALKAKRASEAPKPAVVGAETGSKNDPVSKPNVVQLTPRSVHDGAGAVLKENQPREAWRDRIGTGSGQGLGSRHDHPGW